MSARKNSRRGASDRRCSTELSQECDLFTDLWRDVISIAGFSLTALGLIYAIVQIRKTKSAAHAAEEAANQSLAETHASFQRYAAATAHRFINEAQIHIDNQQWEKAAVRFNDVADQAAQLAALDSEWERLAEELRSWAATCGRHAMGELTRFAKNKWVRFIVRLQAKIDSCHGPFRDMPRERPNDTSQ